MKCANGADGISDMEGKVARVATSKLGNEQFQYLAAIGKRGGVASRRELTRAHAKQMVAIREAKRAAVKVGKPWPPRDGKLLKLSRSAFE